MRSSHHGLARIWATHASEMFQSSWTSWSSKIIGAGDRRQQPAQRRVAPALAVQRRVLLEVADLVGWRVVVAEPSRGDEVLRRRGDLVGVDLVAEQQQCVGPLRGRLVAHALDEGQERVDLTPAWVVVLAEPVGRVMGHRDAAGAEGQAQRLVLRMGADDARGIGIAGRRPHRRAVEAHLVGQRAARCQAVEDDEREVMPGDLEGLRAAVEHRDLAGRVGLHPDGRFRRGDVAQQRAEQEVGHRALSLPARCGVQGRPGRAGRPVALSLSRRCRSGCG